MLPRKRRVAVVSWICTLVSQMHLYAYIDPGSSSFLLQAIVGGVAAILVLARSYWRRSAEFLRNRRRGGEPPAARD